MFSGIVEACTRLSEARPHEHGLTILVPRPAHFDDVKPGDSIAVNGVCLTVEVAGDSTLQFSLGPETLSVTGWNADALRKLPLNLERSLQMGERLHGHLVQGHVDGLGTLIAAETLGESRLMTLAFGEGLRPYIWPKGSIAINGVSLTINQVRGDSFSVCLIPETLRRTNLKDLVIGDLVTLEADMMARGMVHWLNSQGRWSWN